MARFSHLTLLKSHPDNPSGGDMLTTIPMGHLRTMAMMTTILVSFSTVLLSGTLL